jgi:hypothetical protein
MSTSSPVAALGFTRQALYTADSANQGVLNLILGDIGLSGLEHNRLGATKSAAARPVALRWTQFFGSVDLCSALVRGCGHV